MAPLTEVHQHVAHGREDASLRPVSATTAALAVLAACVAILGHRSHTREILDQSRITEAWAHYQSTSARRQTAQVFSGLLTVIQPKDPGAAAALGQRYEQEAERLQASALSLVHENDMLEVDFRSQELKTLRFDLSQAILEASIVVTSVTLLTRRRIFWALGLLFAAAGTALAANALFL